ncbi:MAG: dNTP triphosphohydrolase [Bacteroidaceae bacterium]|nr:dNTP triphosphohydrolase [Bacteroidaceae bacterium]
MAEKNYFSYSRIRDSKTDERRKTGDLKSDLRSPIESDYGRLVFSSAFRRLHDKTQVFPLTTNDNIHSRLTHSMEVASVGRSFALKVCGDKEIAQKLGFDTGNVLFWKNVTSLMEVICLAHDIGNPPLGHFGETAIQNYFLDMFSDLKTDLKNDNTSNFIIRSEIERLGYKVDGKIPEIIKQELESFVNAENKIYYDYTQFDGNAEGFRILTKLQFLNDLYGLNLTSATLAASLKYPNVAKKIKKKEVEYHIPLGKHGVFYTERKYLDIVMDECGIDKINDFAYYRHPLSFLMEAADTICYLLMDLEDAISRGWLSYYDVAQMLNRTKQGKEIVKKAGNHFYENDPDKKKIVQLRTELMVTLVNDAFETFKEQFDNIIEGQYDRELVFEKKDSLAELLQTYSRAKVYSHKEIEALELTGSSVITGLFDYYVKYLFHREESYRMHAKHTLSKAVFMTTLQEHLLLEKSSKPAWDAYDDFDPKDFTYEEKLRIIRDYVACMTDKYAVEQFRKLSGQSI